MQVIQPNFNISDFAYEGLLNGEFVRIGGVIRERATGKIVEILKDAANKDSVNSIQTVVDAVKTSTSITVKKSTSLSLGKKFSVGFFFVVGVAAVSYGTYRLYTYLKKRSDEKKHEEVEKAENEVIIYNPELTEYFNNMQTQSMSISSIKKVVEFFEKFSNGDLSIEISKEEMLVIRNIIVRYTIKLCESNNISLSDKQLNVETDKLSEKELLKGIINAIRVQEEIYVMVENEYEKKGEAKHVKV